MDVVVLPALPAFTTLDEAWSALQASQRSALVTEVRGRLRMFHAADIVHGKHAGLEHLRDLRRGTTIAVLDQERDPPPISWDWMRKAVQDPHGKRQQRLVRHVRHQSSLGRPHKRIRFDRPFATRIERYLDAHGVEIGLLGLEPAAAVILSISEGKLRDSDQAPKSCYCSSALRHSIDGGRTGGKCPIDHTTVRCM